MKTATVNELKMELAQTQQSGLVDLCVRLARFKKENKELLTYLLFEASDETVYVENVKNEILEQFEAINISSLYFVKKSLRKILRVTARYIRYTGSREVEIKLLLYFCHLVKNASFAYQDSLVLFNMYQQQLKNIRTAMASLHEDLQYEYLKELEKLQG